VHEFGIAQSICEVALEEAQRHGASEVVSITCRVGVMRQIVPEIMQTAFELSAEGTLLERAALNLEAEGIRAGCKECGAAQTVYEVPFECPACGSVAIVCSGGQNISLVSIEINQGVGDGDSSSQASRREESS
jgi:hydrogenase nickel incorporation protein HypA/HybF